MSYRKYLFVLAFAAIFIINGTAARADVDTDRVARQFREYCLQESTDHGQRLLDDVEMPTTGIDRAMKMATSQRGDGSWADVDYAGRSRSSWEPAEHLTRVLSMTVCARRTGTSPADVTACLAGVHRALEWWAAHDLKCPNWWFNEIGEPKILGTVALLLGNDLLPDEFKYITHTVLPRSKVGAMTGQNRVWLAGSGVMLAALTHDAPLLQKASAVIDEEINISQGAEGIQPDWSFHQHGAQQQFGNYGLAFAVDMSRWITVLRDTRFAIPPEKVAIIRNYILQGQAWVNWHDMMDVSACGRQLFPRGQQKKTGAVRATARCLATADTDAAKDYDSMTARLVPAGANDLVGNRDFWRSDYIVHRRPDFFVSLKMSSSRIIGGETVNSENLSGARLADGAVYLYRTGHEYENIFPVWDWRKIPGTTSAQDTSPLVWGGKKERAISSFVGGASDGTNACAAMDFHRNHLAAKKAWFFIGNTVACLGADINSSDASQVLTTVNQCLLNGPVMVGVHGQPANLKAEKVRVTDADWAEHDGFRYTFPTPQALTISAAPQSGNWHAVFNNPSAPRADVTEKVFVLCLDHGSSPHDDSYAYFISPTLSTNQPAIRIVSNTAQVQSIQTATGWSAAVFWVPGSAQLDGVNVTVDQPCIVMVDSSGGTRKITLADPTEKLKQITLTIDGKSREIPLPSGGAAGKSVETN